MDCPTSGVSYEGSILLILEITGITGNSWDIQDGINLEPPEKIQRFKDLCKRERDFHNDFSSAWMRKEPSEYPPPSFLNNPGRPDDRLASELHKDHYIPIITYSMDDPDKAFAIVLCNRLDFAHELNSSPDVEIDKLTIAFCPNPLGLCANGYKSDFLKPTEDLIRRRTQGVPLQAFTKIRLNFLLTIGPALNLQKAFSFSLVERIEQTIKFLNSDARFISVIEDFQDPKRSSNINSQNFYYSILDTQDWSEVSILMHTIDLRISSAVNSAISTITISDVIDAGNRLGLENLFEKPLGKGSDSACSVIGDLLPSESSTESPIQKLAANHACGSMFTATNILEDQYYSIVEKISSGSETDSTETFPGMFRLVTKFTCYEGHDLNLHNQLTREFGIPSEKTQDLLPEYTDDWLIVENGHYDQLLFPTNERIVRNLKTVTLERFVEVDWKIKKLVTFRSSMDHDTGSLNIRKTGHRINVPVLKDLFTPRKTGREEGQDRRHPYIHQLLSGLVNSAFGNIQEGPRSPAPSVSITESNEGKALDINLLEDNLRRLGVEAILSREIVSLFKTFRESLGDTVTCSSVIDLWDPFVALFDFLDRKALEMKEKRVSTKADLGVSPAFGFFVPGLSFIGINRGSLERFLNCLKESLRVRMRDSLEREGTRLTSVSARMASIQLLSACDALIKCCGGLVKTFRNGSQTPHPERVGQNPMFANLTSIPGISVDRIQLSSINDLPEFDGASINLNLSHLTHANSLTAYVHEAGHLLYPFFEPEISITSNHRVNCEEIFCDQLVCQLVFMEDIKLFERSYIANILMTPMVGLPKEAEPISLRAQEIVSHLFRLFLVKNSCQALPREHGSELFHTFVDWINNIVTTYFPDLFGNATLDLRQKVLRNVYQSNGEFYATASLESGAFIKEFSRRLVFQTFERGQKKSSIPKAHQKLLKLIRSSLHRGEALSLITLQHTFRDTGVNIDPLTLVRYTLQATADLTLGNNGICSIRSQVARDPDGSVNVEKSKKVNQKSGVLDFRRCGFFTLSPTSSSSLLKIQIASIKTLADLGALLKGRRLKNLVYRASHYTTKIES